MVKDTDKTLSVRLYDESIGVLEQTASGDMAFFYTAEAQHPISLGMPIREEPYGKVQTQACFGGLLPEGEMARMAIGKRYGVNHRNDFSLLKAIGYDCAGAVSLHSFDSNEIRPDKKASSFLLEGKELSDDELFQHIQELPRKPLFMGVDGLRLSLAGAQDKAAVCLIDNEVALPVAGCPTTHILKPEIAGYEGMVHNEYLCLRLAARMGLEVPKVEIRWAHETPYFLIERYDRRLEQIGDALYVRRIHQEDFCQATGVISAHKYQGEGGPDFKSCFDLMLKTTQPVQGRNRLASLLVFNYLIGNMDAHGKNFSILHGEFESDKIELAPVYDVACTRVYQGLSKKMAMKIGGYYEPDKIEPRHWERQCKLMGYSYPALRTMIKKQAEALQEAMAIERALLKEAKLDHPIVDEMARFFEKQTAQVLKQF